MTKHTMKKHCTSDQCIFCPHFHFQFPFPVSISFRFPAFPYAPTHPPSTSLIQQCRNLAKRCLWKEIQAENSYIVLADYQMSRTATLFAPSASWDWYSSSIFQLPDIVLVYLYRIIFCVTIIHHVAFQNFPHELNWVGAFWSKLWHFCRKLKQ